MAADGCLNVLTHLLIIKENELAVWSFLASAEKGALLA